MMSLFSRLFGRDSKVEIVNFQLANGEVVSHPFMGESPVPAEDDRFRMEVAGFVSGPSRELPQQSDLSWCFTFSCKQHTRLTSVVVEEVLSSDEAILMVKDDQPSVVEFAPLKHGVWQATMDPTPISPDSMPWLFVAGPSCFLFKVTIRALESEPTVLYQPSYYSEAMKAAFRGGGSGSLR